MIDAAPGIGARHVRWWQGWACHGVLLCMSGLLVLPAIGAQARPLQLDDLHRITTLSDAQISTDGKTVAVVASVSDPQTDEASASIELVDVASGARRAITRGREHLSMPRWSPDGRQLAFLAKDPASSKTQVFVMPMDGGDPLRATHHPEDVSTFAWSPDGRDIAFVAQDPPVNLQAVKTHNRVFRVTDGHFLLKEEVAPWHLWVVSAEGGEARRLTEGDYSLGTDSGSVTTPTWRRDGKRIAFTRFPGPYWAPSFRSDVAEVDVPSGATRIIVADEGARDFRCAPRGDQCAFRRPRGGDRNNGTAVYVLERGRSHDATALLARHFSSYAWMPDGRTLIAAGPVGTRSAIWNIPLSGNPSSLALGAIEANDGMGTTTSASASDPSVSATGVIAFIGSTSTHPSELYVLDSVRATPRRITDVNAFVDALEFGRTEPIEWDGPDGFREDGVLTYPVAYVPGRRYPLVLLIHGGPTASSNLGFQRLAQLLSAAGFVVFQPNYRGSNNLGDAYQHAMFRDTGDGPGRDVMAGLDAVRRLGIIDAKRVAVTGWSYGGYMAAWLSSHYDVWKAALVGAPVTDWLMDYSISFYGKGDAYFFGSSPWTDDGWDAWREQSPINHVRKVKTPTLIMGSVLDANVPLVNAYEWYHALRDNHVPVEFYAYPIEPHVPQDIVQVVDMYDRWVGWVSRYLN